MSIIHLFIDNPFLFRALVACIAISFICPVLGVFLMLRRMSLMGDAISHAILPGVAIGFMFGGMSIIFMAVGGLIAGICVTVLAGVVSRKTQIKEDASFAGFYLIALAFGVLIISKNGTNLDLMHILFGSILSVDRESLFVIAVITSFSLVILSLIIRPLTIDIFDKNLLKTFNISASFYYLVFLFVVVINVVVDFQVLGTILVVGLMMLPAATSRLISKSFNFLVINAILSSLLSSVVGVLVSYYYDLPTGPTIILTNGFLYLLAIVYAYLLKQINHTKIRDF